MLKSIEHMDIRKALAILDNLRCGGADYEYDDLATLGAMTDGNDIYLPIPKTDNVEWYDYTVTENGTTYYRL